MTTAERITNIYKEINALIEKANECKWKTCDDDGERECIEQINSKLEQIARINQKPRQYAENIKWATTIERVNEIMYTAMEDDDIQSDNMMILGTMAGKKIRDIAKATK